MIQMQKGMTVGEILTVQAAVGIRHVGTMKLPDAAIIKLFDKKEMDGK